MKHSFRYRDGAYDNHSEGGQPFSRWLPMSMPGILGHDAIPADRVADCLNLLCQVPGEWVPVTVLRLCSARLAPSPTIPPPSTPSGRMMSAPGPASWQFDRRRELVLMLRADNTDDEIARAKA
jgi:hypothetical protein